MIERIVWVAPQVDDKIEQEFEVRLRPHNLRIIWGGGGQRKAFNRRLKNELNEHSKVDGHERAI